MRPLRTLAAATLVALALVARPAAAQLSLGLGGGVTSPSGDIQDRQGGGWNALGTLQVGLPLMPIALRGDLQYNSFGGKRFGTITSDDARIVSATVNGVWNIIPLGPVKPYLIGGVGYYSTRFNASNLTSTFDERKFGWNAGVGVKVGLIGIAGFVEARMHTVNDGGLNVGNTVTTARYIPITFGIFF